MDGVNRIFPLTATMSRHRDIRNLNIQCMLLPRHHISCPLTYPAAELDDDALSDGGEELTEEQECEAALISAPEHSFLST